MKDKKGTTGTYGNAYSVVGLPPSSSCGWPRLNGKYLFWINSVRFKRDNCTNPACSLLHVTDPCACTFSHAAGPSKLLQLWVCLEKDIRVILWGHHVSRGICTMSSMEMISMWELLNVQHRPLRHSFSEALSSSGSVLLFISAIMC